VNERRNRNLNAVLAAAAAAVGEQDTRVLADVLTAFRAAGAAMEAGVAVTEPITALSPVGPVAGGMARSDRRTRRRLVAMQFAAVAAIVMGTGLAGAGAGILPSPVQSFVHHVLGGIGVPGPSPDSTPGNRLSASAVPSATSGNGAGADASSASGLGGAASPAPTPEASSSAAELASLGTLCSEVRSSGDAWTTAMSGPEKARLIAAAGSERKVKSYCAHLLHDSGTTGGSAGSSGATAAPSDGGSRPTDSASPAPTATTTRGRGKGTGNNAVNSVATPSTQAP
jgi:hypothetical protein